MRLGLLLLLAALAFAGCSGSDRQVLVGSKKFTESVILGEVLAGLVPHAGLPVRHREALGGTRIVYNALVSGEIAYYDLATLVDDQGFFPSYDALLRRAASGRAKRALNPFILRSSACKHNRHLPVRRHSERDGRVTTV